MPTRVGCILNLSRVIYKSWFFETSTTKCFVTELSDDDECCRSVQREDLNAELEEIEQDATEMDAQVPSRKLLREGYSVQEVSQLSLRLRLQPQESSIIIIIRFWITFYTKNTNSSRAILGLEVDKCRAVGSGRLGQIILIHTTAQRARRLVQIGWNDCPLIPSILPWTELVSIQNQRWSGKDIMNELELQLHMPVGRSPRSGWNKFQSPSPTPWARLGFAFLL